MDDLLAIILLLSLSIYRTARHRFEILYTLKLNLVLPPRRFPSRILFRSCIKIGFSNQWLPKKGSTTNHDSQALPTLYPTLCLYYRKTLWTQWPPSLCLYGKTRERTVCLCGKKYKHSDPECCACTTRQDFLPLQQDKIKTYLPILLENMNTTTQNFVPLQQDKTKTFVCLRQKNTNTMTSNFVP